MSWYLLLFRDLLLVHAFVRGEGFVVLPWCKTDFSGGCALVVGNEGSGVGRLIKEKCDVTVSLPMCGKVNSLNASVAAGIIMYEVARQRLGL